MTGIAASSVDTDAPIPFVDLGAQHREIADELRAAIESVLDDSQFILGPHVDKFEKDFSDFHGGAPLQTVSVSSGTAALEMAAHALNWGPGDEVISVANTWISTISSISQSGARPVLVEVDAATHQIDPAAVEAAITPRTKAVIAVHLFGHPAPVHELIKICQKHHLTLVEDVAQALDARIQGRPVGTYGQIACHSFFPGKNLGCLGDGGAILTSDSSLADRVRMLRNYGQPEKHHHVMLGHNARLDGLQAAVLSVKLKHLRDWNARRRQLKAMYDQALEGLPLQLVETPSYGESVHHLYVIKTDRREALQRHLTAKGIAAQIHYPKPVHLQPCYADLGMKTGALPITESLAGRVLSLPFSPHLTPAQIERVADGIKSFWQDAKA
ncbi:MAG: DegT/DnrJ/EryC1/StrS family aminotransferase [Alphaproteobacteria bacterium]|nr:MAG: DegT/DnrJ/EryC1/StrS family aminotransferase [Alphaproteobacteria bacterium]